MVRELVVLGPAFSVASFWSSACSWCSMRDLKAVFMEISFACVVPDSLINT